MRGAASAMPFVLDASTTLSWAFSDESNPVAERVEALLTSGSETALVPDLWWYEVRNILLVGERRQRISPQQTASFLHQIGKLKVAASLRRDEGLLLDLARRHNLTVYDSAYLALALREHLPLATLDRALVRAAAAEGVALVA